MSARSLTIKTLLLASGRALTALSAIAVTAVLTRALSVDEYATHKQALLIFAMASPLLMLGLPKALLFFVPRAPERARGALFENLGLLALGGAALALALLFGLGDLAAERFDNALLADVAPWLAPYALAMFPLAAIGAALVAADRVGDLLRFNIASRSLFVVVVAGAALLVGTAEATVMAASAWAAVMLVPALWLMRRSMPSDPASAARATLAGARKQLRYAVPLGLASMLGVLSTQLDKLIVSALCDTDAFAIYATGAMELPLVGVVTGAMSAVVLPTLTRYYTAGHPERIVGLWQGAMNTALLILAPIMFAVLLTGPDLMAVLFSEAYTASAEPLRIYALMLPLRAAVYGSVLMATDNTRWVTASAAVGLVLNGVLSVVLVSLVGYAGAAWATVLTTYGVVAFMLGPMGRALNVAPLRLIAWRRIARILAVAGAPALALWGLQNALGAPIGGWSPITRLLAIGGLYGAIVAALYQVTGTTTVAELVAFVRRRPPAEEDAP